LYPSESPVEYVPSPIRWLVVALSVRVPLLRMTPPVEVVVTWKSSTPQEPVDNKARSMKS
jgi:hypothetical protein